MSGWLEEVDELSEAFPDTSATQSGAVLDPHGAGLLNQLQVELLHDVLLFHSLVFIVTFIEHDYKGDARHGLVT